MTTTISKITKILNVDQANPDDPVAFSSTATVSLLDGSDCQVDLADKRARSWLSILGKYSQRGKPIFLDVDVSSRRVRRVLPPNSALVHTLTPLPNGDFEVEFAVSAGRPILRASTAEFSRLHAALLDALQKKTWVLVAETLDTHEILDVQPDPEPKIELAPVPDDSPVLLERAMLPSVVSQKRAKELFSFLSTQPHIPFNYPDDGCHARAHEMQRLLREQGVSCRKQWIYGDLKVATKLSPECVEAWRYHVAPVMEVKATPVNKFVIFDPTLFPRPVSIDAWKKKQSDDNARLETSESSVYFRPANGSDLVFDPDNSITSAFLEHIRDRLEMRIAEVGASPYNCQK